MTMETRKFLKFNMDEYIKNGSFDDKKLTRGNPTMTAKFADLKNSEKDTEDDNL